MSQAKKEKQKGFSKGWILYFCSCILLAILASVFQQSGLAMGISSVCGIIYVLLIAKNIKIAYLFGILNVIIYGILLLTQKIYGSAIYSLIYCFPMYIYGYFHWKNVEGEENGGIQYLSPRVRVIGTILAILVIAVYTVAVSLIGGSFALLDGINVVTGFIAVYLLANKYFEQWPVYIVMNIAGLIMWSILSIQNIQNLPLACMWLIYTVNSIYACISWARMRKKQQS